jgi:hypothetical protein
MATHKDKEWDKYTELELADEAASEVSASGEPVIIWRSVPIGSVSLGTGEFPPEIAALEEITEALKTEWRNGSLEKRLNGSTLIHDRFTFNAPNGAAVKVLLGDFGDNA